MSQIIIAKTGEDRYCLVKVPDGAFNFSLEMNMGKLNVSYETKLSIYETIETPFKYASIVGIGRELSADQWKEIVEEIMPFGRVNRYMDYEYPESGFYKVDESGLSFLRSHGADESFLILKDNG